MKIIHRLALSLCVVALVSNGAARAADSTQPVATAPAIAPNFTTPADTLKSFLRAQAGTDPAPVRNSLLVPAARKDDVDAFLNFSAASNELQAEALGKFGKDGEKFFGPAPSSFLDARIKALADVPVKIDGDSALIDLPANPAAGQAGGPIHLTKTDGSWKIEALTFFKLGPDFSHVPERVTQARKLATLAKDVAKEIREGKITSATDAYRAYSLPAAAILKSATATAPAATTAPAAPATMQQK